MNRAKRVVADDGFDVSLVGNVLFVRQWGVMSTPLVRQYVQRYQACIAELDNTPWAEVMDFRRVTLVDRGLLQAVKALYTPSCSRQHCATAYLFSRYTDPRLRLLLQTLEDPHSWGISSRNFDNDFRAGLNWVNERLNMFALSQASGE
ncbi:hypothetical protein [Atopomonas sediminilitoris]|uniref:hypothetical protein n=1 Tax=Atopomonas sediminilitoris TaxID=2919919 RepID=UPI001F4D6C9E|nr:hypothetical protein [Atopomonas sediminilitoris]MCJ8169576.1 hypothetical protein [Atopomonas sediminilitoris]